MIVILTEKYSAAQNFATALGGMKGKYNGENYQIVFSAGHLFEYPNDPSKLSNADYKKWTLDTIPWVKNDFTWKKVQKPKVTDLLKKIKESSKNATEMVIATDNDASGEGSMIAWEILDYIKFKGKISRMYFIDESPKRVQEAFINRQPLKNKQSDKEYLKAEARERFDYFSMQYTRASSIMFSDMSNKVFKVLRQGRVKTVMVTEVGKQEDKVKNYVKTPYYTIRFTDNNGHIYKRSEKKEIRVASPEELNVNDFKKSNVIVDSETVKTTAPSLLIDISKLTAILSSYGYSPKSILNTYSKMYHDNVVSYPRTDDKNITTEQFNELLPYVDKIANLVDVDTSLLIYRKPRKTHVYDKGSHGANRPTTKVPKSKDEIVAKYGKLGLGIYKALAKSYLAMLAEDYEYKQQKGHLELYPDFTATANIPLKLGFKKVFDSDTSVEKLEVSNKPLGTFADPNVVEGFNPAPKNPTVDWLMNLLKKYNVGTGATKTAILSDITKEDKMKLMNLEKGKLSLTPLGNESYLIMQNTKLSNPETTEFLWNEMEKVSNSEKQSDDVVEHMRTLITSDLPIMKNNLEIFKDKFKEIQASKPTYEVKEKVKGLYKPKNIEVSFNVIWGSHTFTEEEIIDMLDGKEITITYKTKRNEEKEVSGKLEEQTFKKSKFWGFKPNFTKE